MRKPAAHKKMMKKHPHKDPPKGTKAYKKHEKRESAAVERLDPAKHEDEIRSTTDRDV